MSNSVSVFPYLLCNFPDTWSGYILVIKLLYVDGSLYQYVINGSDPEFELEVAVLRALYILDTYKFNAPRRSRHSASLLGRAGTGARHNATGSPLCLTLLLCRLTPAGICTNIVTSAPLGAGHCNFTFRRMRNCHRRLSAGGEAPTKTKRGKVRVGTNCQGSKSTISRYLQSSIPLITSEVILD